MASSDAVLALLTQVNEDSKAIVREQSKLDLESYIRNYTERTRFERLIHIGLTSVPLCIESLKAAVNEAKSGTDTTRYKEAWDLLRKVAPNEPEAQRDETWIEETDKTAKSVTSHLETVLKGYKNNLVKESIRMTNEELGKHFEKVGKLPAATEAFGRMRQDVSTTKQIVDCSLLLAGIALQRKDWPSAVAHATKVWSMPNVQEHSGSVGTSRIIAGVGYIGQGNYTEAARNFLMADYATSPSDYSHIASPNDIAVYGGLLSLATMDRNSLQSRVLDSQNFRSFLETEPQIRKAISLFVNGRYSACLAILESTRADYLLDIYLFKHVQDLYAKIRSKCIMQYFIPFSCVTLESLESAFAAPGASLEDELLAMIRRGTLKAKIDTKNKLLVAVQPDPRAEMQRQALQVAHGYEKEATERLRRMGIVCSGLEVVGPKKAQAHGQVFTPGLTMDSSFLEESQAAEGWS